jgi:hypothetical protein
MIGNSTKLATIAIVASTFLVGAAHADDLQVDLSGFVNADLTTYTGGAFYPQNGGDLTIGTIPFSLATIGPSFDTGIVQSLTAQTFSIPVDTFGVTSAYVLVNSAYGACGTDIGAIDFVGSSGTFTYPLTEGANVRDHFDGAFCNTAPDVAGTASFGSDRLDMQSIALPADFSGETLESIDFVGFGEGQLGSPFLAAATLVTSDAWNPPAATDSPTVPEPPSFLFVCVAAALMLLIKRLRFSN